MPSSQAAAPGGSAQLGPEGEHQARCQPDRCEPAVAGTKIGGKPAQRQRCHHQHRSEHAATPRQAAMLRARAAAVNRVPYCRSEHPERRHADQGRQSQTVPVAPGRRPHRARQGSRALDAAARLAVRAGAPRPNPNTAAPTKPRSRRDNSRSGPAPEGTAPPEPASAPRPAVTSNRGPARSRGRCRPTPRAAAAPPSATRPPSRPQQDRHAGAAAPRRRQRGADRQQQGKLQPNPSKASTTPSDGQDAGFAALAVPVSTLSASVVQLQPGGGRHRRMQQRQCRRHGRSKPGAAMVIEARAFLDASARTATIRPAHRRRSHGQLRAAMSAGPGSSGTNAAIVPGHAEPACRRMRPAGRGEPEPKRSPAPQGGETERSERPPSADPPKPAGPRQAQAGRPSVTKTGTSRSEPTVGPMVRRQPAPGRGQQR